MFWKEYSKIIHADCVDTCQCSVANLTGILSYKQHLLASAGVNVAAAVLIPLFLLLLIGIAVLVYFKRKAIQERLRHYKFVRRTTWVLLVHSLYEEIVKRKVWGVGSVLCLPIYSLNKSIWCFRSFSSNTQPARKYQASGLHTGLISEPTPSPQPAGLAARRAPAGGCKSERCHKIVITDICDVKCCEI